MMTTTTERIAAMLEAAKAKAQKQEAILKKHRADIQATAKESPDMILSAMPAKLQNLQDCMTYMEILQREIEVLEELKKNE